MKRREARFNFLRGQRARTDDLLQDFSRNRRQDLGAGLLRFRFAGHMDSSCYAPHTKFRDTLRPDKLGEIAPTRTCDRTDKISSRTDKDLGSHRQASVDRTDNDLASHRQETSGRTDKKPAIALIGVSAYLSQPLQSSRWRRRRSRITPGYTPLRRAISAA